MEISSARMHATTSALRIAVQRRRPSGGRSASVMGCPLGCRTGILFPNVSAAMVTTHLVDHALRTGKTIHGPDFETVENRLHLIFLKISTPPFSFVFNTSTGHTGHMLRTPKLDLAAGQRFRAPDGIVWEVLGPIRTNGGRPHVALVKLDDRLTKKVVSVDALYDKRLFSIVE